MTFIRFTKMHGIGNDYLYVDAFANNVPEPIAPLARAMSDRHFGVGADGLILIGPPTGGTRADVRMRMFNADGSESEMCGNGIRCVCKYAHDRGLSKANPMRIETGRGVLTLEYTLGRQGRVEHVTVDMGEPILDPAQIPVDLGVAGWARESIIDRQGKWGFLWSEDAGFDGRITCLSMGNPHGVFFCANVQAVPLEELGPAVETDRAFPNRINVHIVQVHSRTEVTMRTWERGSGITLACGTGAAAVCVAGVLTNRTDREILAHLPGGDLRLRWDERTGHVFKTGPATEIFDGVWDTDRAAGR